MKTKIIDKILIVLSCLFFILVTFYSYNTYTGHGNPYDAADGELIITNLDVGKADAAVISLDGVNGMIDTGTKDNYDQISNYLDTNHIKSLDFLILTHYDKDHVGSAKKIIKNYNISKIMVPDYVSEKKYYEPLQEIFKTMDNVDTINETESYEFGSLTLNIYPSSDPSALAAESNKIDNNMSLVVSMSYGVNKFLFMGDTEEARMNEILADGIDISADWVKMPHHGAFSEISANDVQEKLIEAIAPIYAVISTSSDQFTTESAQATKESLSKNHVKYFCTADGNVITKSDGASITVTQ